MKHAIDQYPLLYQLFLKIQHYDRQLGHLALGVKEFYALIEALNHGVGLSDEQHFKKVIRLLWRKPHHDQAVFETLLESALQSIYEIGGKTTEQHQDKQAPSTPSHKDLASDQKTETKERIPEISAEEEKNKEDRADTGERTEEDSLIISFEKASPDKDEASLQLDIEQLSEEIGKYHFVLQGNYFELGSRQLQQGVRTMRRREIDKRKKVVDLEATVDKVSRQGFLESLEYRYGEKWTTDLIVLIDRGESMLAFEPFSEDLISVIDEDYDINETIYFFKSAPYQQVFSDRLFHLGTSIRSLSEASAQPVLIVSDAGAATGQVNEELVEDTVDFLARMRKHRVAWLNPMPRDRWRKTSAEYIALYTSMFFLDPTELINVVKLFKAKMKSSTLLDKYVQEMY